MPGRSPWSLPHAAGSQLADRLTGSPLRSLGCCPLPGGSVSCPTQDGLLSGLFASSKLAPGSTWGAHQPQLSPVPPPAGGKVSSLGRIQYPSLGCWSHLLPLPASQRPQAARILAPTLLLRPQTGLILELHPIGSQAYCFTLPQITRALLHATMLVQMATSYQVMTAASQSLCPLKPPALSPL